MGIPKHRGSGLSGARSGARSGDALRGGGGGFVFDFDGPRLKVSDAEMVAALRTRHAQVGGPFTIAEFNAWAGRPCSGVGIQRRFGSWRRALAMAGIDGGKGRNYGAGELMDNLEAVWRAAGWRPGATMLERHGTIGVAPYVRVWGSLREACRRLALYKRGRMTRREMLRSAPRGGRGPVSARLRWRVLEAGGHRCCGCGRTSKERGVRLEVDHIVPRCAGGTDELKNLRVLCLRCNRGKGGLVGGAGR